VGRSPNGVVAVVVGDMGAAAINFIGMFLGGGISRVRPVRQWIRWRLLLAGRPVTVMVWPVVCMLQSLVVGRF